MEKLRIAMEENPDERNVGRYLKAEEMFRTSGGYAADSEARAMAVGLGLPDDRLELPLSVLSGGERRRVELARILFAGTDVLCLDEPTNHLDIDAKTWLLQYMRQYKGALLVISHDLDLLDEAITRVLHLDRTAEDDVGEIFEYAARTRSISAPGPRTSPANPQGSAAVEGDRPACKPSSTASAPRPRRRRWRTAMEKTIARLEIDRVRPCSEVVQNVQRVVSRHRRPMWRHRDHRDRVSARGTAECPSISKTSASTSDVVSGCLCSA